MFYRRNKHFIFSAFFNVKDYKTIILIVLFQLIFSSLFAKTYFVSAKGNNQNLGTKQHPFYSIQFASKKLNPGDTLFIRGGNYTENCVLTIRGTKKNPIVIQNFHNEKVQFIPSSYNLYWKKYSKYIYRAKIKKRITQIFVNEKPVMQACYPNICEGEFNKASWKSVYVSPTKNITFKIPKNKNFYHSKFIGICGRGTISVTGKVINQKNNQVKIQNSDFYWDKKYKTAYLGKGKGYFVGNKSFIDTLNEWFSDDQFLYWFGKPDKNLKIRYRTNQDIFILNKCTHLKIRGIKFKGKSISFGHSSQCSLNEISCEYPTSFFDFENSFDRFGLPHQYLPQNWSGNGLILNGFNNQIKNSMVTSSWGDGITIYGSKNQIINSVITNCNWMGTDAAAVNLSGKKNSIQHCFLSKCGRSVLLHRKSYQCKILYNEISEGGYLCDDLGLTYTYDTDGKGTEIAYNWVHHNRAPHYGSGIYLDNNHSNFNVHHNVIWKCFVGMTINQIATNDRIYNNTFIKNKYTMGSGWFSEYAPILKNIYTYNNITDSDLTARDQQAFYGSIQTNNIFIPHLSNFLKNPSKNDFRIERSRIDTINSIGAYNKNKCWKAGLIQTIPFDNESSPTKIYNYKIQLIIYFLILTSMLFLISRVKFYQNLNLNKFILFFITIFTGIIYWFVFTSLFPNRETAELFKHFDDAKFIYDHYYEKNTLSYFEFLITGNTSSKLTEILHQTNFWFYQTQPGHFGDNHLLIKFHAWILPISMGNIFTHLLFFSFISFQGFVFLFKFLRNQTVSNFYFLIGIPSFWLIASSGTKDAFIFTALTLFIYLSHTLHVKKYYFWIGLTCSLLFLYVLRPYVFLALIPYVLIQLIEKWFQKKPSFLLIFVTYIGIFIVLLQIHQIQLFETLKFKQQDLILVAKEMHARTTFDILPLLEPIDLFKNSLISIYNVLFRPLLIHHENAGLLCIILDNWIILILLSISLYKLITKKTQINYNLFFLCILAFLFIGWTIPISGVILRYRAIILPFLLLALNYTKSTDNHEI